MVVSFLKLRMIRIPRARHFRDANDGRGIGIAVIEQYAVADGDVVAQEIANLVIAYAVPERRAVALEIGDAVCFGLGFEEPVSGRT